MSGTPSLEARAATVVQLLWRQREAARSDGAHGGAAQGGVRRRGRLSVDGLVDAALAVADTEGLDAVTMRRLAQALGVAPMTPYRHVPGKAELLDLMVDEAFARMPTTMRSVPPKEGWRARVLAVAADRRALLRARPWLLEVQRARPVLGPGVIGTYERELAAFEGLDLSDVERDAALSSLHALVEATVRAELDASVVARDSGADDARWWAAAGPALATVLDPEAFPLATRIGAAVGEAQGRASDPDAAYSFGIGRFLDGLDVLVTAPGERYS